MPWLSAVRRCLEEQLDKTVANGSTASMARLVDNYLFSSGPPPLVSSQIVSRFGPTPVHRMAFKGEN